MSGFIDGRDRHQTILLPDIVDDDVTAEDPVRFIDAFVENLDVEGQGFSHATPREIGRPPYDPRDLLKLYLYGYLNRVRSSRRLETECQRNVEVMWLMRKLAPDFKTIADFRKDNADQIRPVFRELIALCKRLGLLDADLVAIDGSKFKAVNSTKRHYTPKSLRESLTTLDEKIARYLRELDENDEKEAKEERLPQRVPDLPKKIAALKERKKQQTALLERMEAMGETEVNLTDPECRAMRTNDGAVDLCYNTQIAVEAKNKLIVEYDVTNRPTDDQELSSMAARAREGLGVDHLKVTADRGYYSGEQIQRCGENDITPYVPEMNVRSGAMARNRLSPDFALDKFVYDPSTDTLVCPAGQRLTPAGPVLQLRMGHHGRTRQARIYRTVACFTCPHYMGSCTHDRKGRHVIRTEFDAAMEAMRLRTNTPEGRQILRFRQELVEHPFGTIKRGFHQGYLLLRGLRKTAGEMGLTLTAYNLRRALNLVGTPRLVSAVQTAY